MEDKNQLSPKIQSPSLPDPADARHAQAQRQADAAEKYAAMEDQKFDFKNTTPARRTPAQREASRRNGARSRGPITLQGKIRSSANALSHGLLARLFTPPGDVRDHDRLYRKILQELTNEFNPQTFTQRATIAQLAHDFLQLGRAKEMIEILQQPSVGQDETDRYRQIKANRRLLNEMKSIIRQIDKVEPFSCAARDADCIVDSVGKYVEGVEAEATNKETIPIEQMDAFDREEDQKLQAQWARLRPFKAKLTNRQHLSAVLSGGEKTTPAVLKQLRNVLEFLVGEVRGRLERAEKIKHGVENARRQKVIQLANEPDKLILHQLYASRIERSIKRKIAEIRKW